MAQKHVFHFGEGEGSMKDLLGGKGANLAEMTKLGIPVPPGFVVGTTACTAYYDAGRQLPDTIWKDIEAALVVLEKDTGKTFGGSNEPLFVSVRSGAKISMPGMMDTILNLGMNDKTVEVLAESSGDARFAYDSYRRFIQMYSNVVLDLDHHDFERIIKKEKEVVGVQEDTDLSAEDWKKVVKAFLALVRDRKGADFPTDPVDQLRGAVEAVFRSWMNDRACTYRKIHRIPQEIGTAVTVQSMVFGNLGQTSGTGVAFTRNPSTGEKKLFGEFLVNAQGEDVVAGIRTPQAISELKSAFPTLYAEFEAIAEKLENHFCDMQDIEFTIEKGKLYLLQTRSGKRAAVAALRIAIDMVAEKRIDKKTALLRIEPECLNQLLHPRIKDGARRDVVGRGLPASPGAAVGKVVFTAHEAVARAAEGENVILIRHETSPEDIQGMHVSRGILTACGGMTSHAAVVARGMGTPCVSGATELLVKEEDREAHIGHTTIREGDFITLDGATGEIIFGECETQEPTLSGDLETVLEWAEQQTRIGVRTNADTPEDARRAREFGAKGIGLCRTEHMFFDEYRIHSMRRMILSRNEEEREKALEALLPFQRKDFIGIFEAMEGLPVTVRYLDPPLHEFLPHKDREKDELAKSFDISRDELDERISELDEVNPMLGHRGCRLMVTYPEIARMQTRAVMEAACEVHKTGKEVLPELMVPLVGLESEMEHLREIILHTAKEVQKEAGVEVPFRFGTMVEVPRACLIADKLAGLVDFFSFGTNDLTQMTFGFSRDDTAKFLPEYMNRRLLQVDPFETLDRDGVGKLIALAVESARAVNPDIKIGICGEHGGDPESIDFCFHHDFQTVSCSPFRVPIARLAAAQSALRKWEE